MAPIKDDGGQDSIDIFQETGDWLSRLSSFSSHEKQERAIRWCGASVQKSQQKIRKHDDLYQIEDDHLKTVMEMMTLLLSQAKSCQNQNTSMRNHICFGVLALLSILVLESNKRLDCETWVKERMSDLKALRDNDCSSLLHIAANIHFEPLVRLLVEEGKMDVNVVNSLAATPLHELANTIRYRLFCQKELTQDMERVAELLITNGAHFDLVDDEGMDAYSVLSSAFPRLSSYVNLKCLAANAILKHSATRERYEKVLPSEMITFVEAHKRPRS